ncbi:AI-2E family transporter [Bacteroides gallinaceum]|jgi:predicted PurR-regulated permease PerM|uniref:AI-2E family transporter n=2 Tax=Bacteroidaceae TaxID=815 RepID=A0ABT7X632_9BACE|nr:MULTISPECIES: AI-2E family transporter [Bacteroidaceae]CCZ69739.1 putative uncharacterized protein [Bacteroides sp. CAG:702]HJD09956.1 AI-2E family transporter [Candidatus Phocaeicola caecigallinarum]MBD8041718.1 AI-2E family transporter [Phocaeicola intestinalis]MBM6657126.1 AI-2E family transporter [Bacteroides gallinaceum]MBM6718691.1 AI-2E family transporter [Bacteroides gallinaceum]
MKEQYWKYSLIIMIVGLGILLFRQAQPFMNGILGAFTLYLLLRGFSNWLKKKIKPLASVWIITIGTTLFILIPLSLFSWALVNQISNLHFDTADIIRPAQQMISIIEEKTGFDVLSEKNLSFIISQVSSIGHSIMTGVSDLIVNLAVAIMLLFFMLWEGDKMEQFISELLPFEENNKREVLQKIQLIVRSNAIGIPLLAIIQGFISLFGYLLCHAPNPVLTAMLTGFASIVPLVGTALVWVPVTAYFFIIGDWVHGLILLAYGGIIISQCDNLIRFILQKKMANIHPLITIFGVVAGLPIFGFMGIIFGPLLVSLFLLFLDMFRKEYLTNN